MARHQLNGRVVSNNDAVFYKWWGLDVCCPNDIREAIENCPEDEDLTFEVNSGGGSVYAGFEMYTILRQSGRKVTAEVQSLAGSAMSVMICGCDTVLVSPVANLMVHRSSCGTHGNAEVHRQSEQMLNTIDESILNAYEEKSGGKCSRTKLRHMIENETFLTPQQAIDCGLADGMLQRPGAEEPAADPDLAIASADAEEVGDILMKNVLAMGQLPSVEDLKRMMAEQGLNIDSPEEESVQNTHAEEREEQMEPKTIEELTAAFPDLVAEIQENARASERERISAIDAVALPGFEDIVNAAKADPAKTAGDVAMEIVAQQKKQGQTFLSGVRKDAENSGANNVPAAASETGEKDDDPVAEAKAAADLWKKNRGVK